MGKKLKLAFLWHMHQPYYKDDKSSETLMPWVFLHSIKDYYDIPWYGKNFKKIKATYNLVPSLIEQINSYINNSANDKLLEILKKDVRFIDDNDLSTLNSYLFLSNEKNMILPLDRYYKLYLKYKSNNNIKDFTNDEVLDSEVLFLLSWCGVYLRTNNDIVKNLLQKGSYFTHNDKIELIDTLINFLPSILEYYKTLNISTTPYFHPITPLLLDINSAKEARFDSDIPHLKSSFKYFAEKNITDGINYFNKNFGRNPTGFWSSEGSVSQKTAELFSLNNLKWFATDEEILFKTLNNRDKKNIYKNYTINNNINIRFRDHFLSDAIGFEYSQKNPKESAENFISHLKDIYNSCDFNPLVNIILDGENAWEFYPNNGYNFFYELYTLLEKTSWIECVTMDDITNDKDIETVNLSHIESGSWINGNFDIWIGSKEKNRAWELLDITKQEYDKQKDFLNQDIITLIEKEFMIALGSDWFWWYGDDHFTIQAKEFDELFRKHLINIYNYMNKNIPIEIITPIIKDKQNSFHILPNSFIDAEVDGKKTDYFEWLDCGEIDISKQFSVMDSTKNGIKKILYGYNNNSISFLFEGNFSNNEKIFLFLDDIEIKELDIAYTDLYIEAKIFRKNIFPSKLDFKFILKKDNNIIQTFPLYSNFSINLENLKLIKWYI